MAIGMTGVGTLTNLPAAKQPVGGVLVNAAVG
jgi:hypothetical protein